MKSEIAVLIVGLSLVTPTPAHAQADLLTGIMLQAMPAIMAFAEKAMRPNPEDHNEDARRRDDSTKIINNVKIKADDNLTINTSSLHYATATSNVIIDGDVVGGGKISALSVDGTDAPFHPNGHFSFNRAVPIGESRVRLVARDEWGRSAQIELTVTRSQPNAEHFYAPLSPGKSKGAQHPNRMSIIIGIEKYEDVPISDFSDRDALLFYDYAINEIGIHPANVLVLTNEKARRRDIDKAVITWLMPQIVRGETDVLIFFSGHGLAAENGELFLVPADGDPNLLERSAIRRRELVEILVGSGARSVTLFLDTCYSGLSRTKNALIASSRPISIANKTETLPPNVSILAASANDQVSSSLSQVRHGLFSYHLMKGIEGGAAQNAGSITLEDLSRYLESHVATSAAKLGRTQSPQLIGDGSLKVVER